MAKKKRTPARRATSVKLKGRKANPRRTSVNAPRVLGRVVLPLVISGLLIAAIAFFGMSALKTATASDFFKLQSVDVRGNDRTTADDIRRIVIAGAEKPGVWDADLAEIRTKIEKFPFVKSAAVSRVLPAGIRVNITERVPAAVVHLTSGAYLVDGEGAMLATVAASDKTFPFLLDGWDESKTEKAVGDNLARLRMYKKMLDEWQQFDLASRVKAVNLANTREPVAVVEDSGRAIAVTLAKDNFGKSLKTAVEALTGKGARIRSVDAAGVFPVIQYIEF